MAADPVVPQAGTRGTNHDWQNPALHAVTAPALDRRALHTVVQALPSGTAIPILREHLLTLLEGGLGSIEEPTVSPHGLLTADQVAQRLAVGTQWVYRHKRELGAISAGRAIRFSEQGINKYLERRRRTLLQA
jgi:excisionase family DNA binding protein